MAVKRKKSSPRQRAAAATVDIIGQSQSNPPVPARWKKNYNLLLIARDYLLHQQKHLVQSAREDQPAFGLHMAEVATDNFDRDFALSRASSEQEVLNEINAALARIRDGTFGICELTGKPIERARLEAIPWTRFSKSAEQELEKEGGIRRAQLAPRHAVPHGGDENESEEATGEKSFLRQ